jgi:RimJ/RimL family protein N-acetyltransferase
MLSKVLDIETALITPRTVVRRFRENDGQAFFPLFQENMSMLQDRFPKIVDLLPDKEQIELFVRRQLALWLLYQEFTFGIWSKDTALPIGYVRLTNLDWTVPRGELLLFLDRNCHQKGIMTEVLLQIIHFSFDQLKFEKLSMRVESDNYPAQRLARKCGFQREGDLRSEFRKISGETVDLMVFGLTKSKISG